ncbi:hypothetical protein B0J11DRAFT_603577 [Dendryphion nanum]|uniref:Uncharacterized protein n=1 Tax=Dendryphion nanum TaxID=256645 RepID=A0A9P9IQ25_9PLEO|nr:hypothetical protein B0J11DRAFT_603577 [Dendryphion nanum]
MNYHEIESLGQANAAPLITSPTAPNTPTTPSHLLNIRMKLNMSIRNLNSLSPLTRNDAEYMHNNGGLSVPTDNLEQEMRDYDDLSQYSPRFFPRRKVPPPINVPLILSATAYTRDILCFSTRNQPVTADNIRGWIRANCTPLCLASFPVPVSEVPTGSWTLAFAPHIFENGAWMITFAVPEDSEFVWMFWTERGDTNREVFDYLKNLAKDQKVKIEKAMKYGDERHATCVRLCDYGLYRYHTEISDSNWKLKALKDCCYDRLLRHE